MVDRAILLVSFGSADDTIRVEIFDKLAAELKKSFPTFEVRQAFTSNFMIRKLARRGIFMSTPAEEILRLRGDGCRKIFLLPTHLTPGEEFDNKIKICAAADVEIIPPLFSADCATDFDKKIFATILDCFKPSADEDLILIGHGSPHRHNPVYEALQRLAGENVHIGVIEPDDTPNFADVVKRLESRRAEKILLTPLLLNGGVHVAEDICGDDKNSWRNRLTARGYKVRVVRDGLGSFESFRALYVDKLCKHCAVKSKTFVKDLFIIDALQNADALHPKTARDVLIDVEQRLHEIFPTDFDAPDIDVLKTKQVPPTVSKHVDDMNATGLYDIRRHRDNKLGYFNATEGNKFPFTPAEFALIAVALYRTPSISTDETRTLLAKFENLIGATGTEFGGAIVKRQIDAWQGIRRKTHREVLPTISELLKAIINGRQISFKLYERSSKHAGEEVPLRTRKKSRKHEDIVETFRVSPYFLTVEHDEYYLIGYSHYPNYDSPEGQQLTHFKVALIAELKILDEAAEHLRRMDFYARYAMESHPYYTDRATRDRLDEIENILQTDDAAFKNFSLDRYVREHIYLATNSAPIVDVTIEFDKDFAETVLTQFTMKQIIRPADADGKLSTIITVQDNDGLYRWLMHHSDKVKVLGPQKVRQTLHKRLEAALKILE